MIYLIFYSVTDVIVKILRIYFALTIHINKPQVPGIDF